MQIRTKLGLVDIPNEVIMAAARDIAGSADSTPVIAAPSGSLGVGGGSAFADAILSASLANDVRRACDDEIGVLEKDLSAVTRGEGPEQPRIDAEKTRLHQAIAALKKIRDRVAPPSDLLLDSSLNTGSQPCRKPSTEPSET